MYCHALCTLCCHNTVYHLQTYYCCVFYCILLPVVCWWCDCVPHYNALRYERTAAESQTLSAVKQELEKIDTILSNDVLILRDKIEEVNRKFECSRFAKDTSFMSLCTCITAQYIWLLCFLHDLTHASGLDTCTGSDLNMLKRNMSLQRWNFIKQLKQRSS